MYPFSMYDLFRKISGAFEKFNDPLVDQKSGSCFVFFWYNVLPVSHPKFKRPTHRTTAQVCDATTAPHSFNSSSNHCLFPLYPQLQHTTFRTPNSPIFAALKMKEI